ncbi:peptide ABC transporter substrate-binding protein [Lacticaseibacillus suihuaensis]
MMKKTTLGITLTAAALTLLLSACGGKKSAATTATLNLVQASDPTTVDVNDVRNANEFDVLNATQEGLFRITSKNGHDGLQLAQAKSYTVSKDGLTYTFKLRSAKWSDGKAVTAQQFVDSIIRELTPKNAFAYASMAYDIKGAEAFNTGKGTAAQVGAKALDAHTLQLTLANKTPYFLKKLASVVFYPVRLDLIKQAGGTKAWKTDWQDQVSNGAYTIQSWKKNGKIVLAKNPKFWNAKKVSFTKVNITTTAKDATVLSLLQSGQLDFVKASGAQAADFDKLSSSAKLIKSTQASGNTSFLAFNQHNGGLSKLMTNAKIRQALSLAINREAYNKAVANGQSKAVYSFVPASISVGTRNYHDYAGDLLRPALAKYNTNAKLQALFKAGLKELGQSTDLAKVKLTYLTMAGDEDTSSFLAQTYKKSLGITVKAVVAPDSASFIAARNGNKYDLLTNGWNGDYDDPSTFLNLWVSTGGFQQFFGGYNDPAYDKLYATLAPVADTKSRLAIYKRLETLLLTKDYGVAPLISDQNRYYVAKDIKGIQTPTFGPDLDYVYASRG